MIEILKKENDFKLIHSNAYALCRRITLHLFCGGKTVASLYKFSLNILDKLEWENLTDKLVLLTTKVMRRQKALK